jgi:hypothetical protein
MGKKLPDAALGSRMSVSRGSTHRPKNHVRRSASVKILPDLENSAKKKYFCYENGTRFVPKMVPLKLEAMILRLERAPHEGAHRPVHIIIGTRGPTFRHSSARQA